MGTIVRLRTLRGTLIATMLLVATAPALAGEAATIVFRSGQVVRINDGYSTVIAAMSKLNTASQAHSIVNLNIGGGSFLLNVAEAVIVCRDHCPSLEVVDVRDPARTPTR
jgi:hypothetical protein